MLSLSHVSLSLFFRPAPLFLKDFIAVGKILRFNESRGGGDFHRHHRLQILTTRFFECYSADNIESVVLRTTLLLLLLLEREEEEEKKGRK